VFTNIEPGKYDFSIKDADLKALNAGDPWVKILKF